MKKLFIFAFLAVLTSALVYSAPLTSTQTMNNTSGEYYAYVGCLPTLTGGSSIVLGNFFTGQSSINVSSAGSQVYNLNGPNISQDPTVIYNIKANGGGLKSSGFIINGTLNPSGDKLTGGWAIVEADGLGLDPGEYNIGTGDYHMSEATDFTCSAAPWRATFQPSSLQTGTMTGSETFPITFTVVCTL